MIKAENPSETIAAVLREEEAGMPQEFDGFGAATQVPDFFSNVAAIHQKATIAEPTHEVPAAVDPLLVEILSFPRQHGSPGELEFQEWLGTKLHALNEGASGTVERLTSFRLYAINVPRLSGKPSSTLFSCHCDTIDGNFAKGERKKLTYDGNFGLIALDEGSIGGSLGADDGVGVWIMLKMIEARVPGTYIFHRQEESGGVSAKEMARTEKSWLKKFDCSIAFDRPNTSEIITHQGGMECASMKFGLALVERLNNKGMAYSPSSRGVYTDNREYRSLIAENVNIGVGYHSQHGRREELDYGHANALLEACVKIEWDSLPIERDHTKVPVQATQNYTGTGMRFGAQMDFDGGYRKYLAGIESRRTPAASDQPKKRGRPSKADKAMAQVLREEAAAEQVRLLEVVYTMTATEMWDMASNDPDTAGATMAALVRENARLAADVDALELLLKV